MFIKGAAWGPAPPTKCCMAILGAVGKGGMDGVGAAASGPSECRRPAKTCAAAQPQHARPTLASPRVSCARASARKSSSGGGGGGWAPPALPPPAGTRGRQHSYSRQTMRSSMGAAWEATTLQRRALALCSKGSPGEGLRACRAQLAGLIALCACCHQAACCCMQSRQQQQEGSDACSDPQAPPTCSSWSWAGVVSAAVTTGLLTQVMACGQHCSSCAVARLAMQPHARRAAVAF